jgi:hypothetical protein
MKTAFARIWKNRNTLLTAALLTSAVALAPSANAEPITYTLQVVAFPGDTGPSGTVGGSFFGGPGTNDTLTFTFQGDTSNVVPFSVTGASGFEILVGTASFTITDETNALIAQGTFLPSDGIFVSVDNTNFGSVGFGSAAIADQTDPNFPGLPTYPYGMAFGGLNTYDMKSNVTVPLSFGALVFSCIGFPNSSPINGDCLPPTALATTAGDLIVDVSPSGHDQTGTFTAVVAEIPEPSSLLFLGTGLLGLMWLRKTRFR